MSIKERFNHIKTFVDIWKVWIFFAALLFGTNGAQMYVHSEPEKAGLPIKKVKPVATNPARTQKTIIIHKTDNSYCDKKINEHENGSRH